MATATSNASRAVLLGGIAAGRALLLGGVGCAARHVVPDDLPLLLVTLDTTRADAL